MNSVLIIDDDKELCALMKKCVEQENLSAVVAYGGLEGLRLLEENKDACSLIILDVMMPDKGTITAASVPGAGTTFRLATLCYNQGDTSLRFRLPA